MLASRELTCSVKLADFGLSESISHVQATGGSQAGTIGYAAPEILRGEPYGTESDMWSLGCLLYMMLTVCLPFPLPKKRGNNKKINYSDLDLEIDARQVH